MAEPNVAALIVAGGRGTRVGQGVPKQYLPLGGVPILQRTVQAFLSHAAVSVVQVVIHPDDTALYHAAMSDLSDPRVLTPAFGGATRGETVAKGLAALTDAPPDLVLIHDAARPLVPQQVISATIEALSVAQGALAALEVVDALWHGAEGHALSSAPREGLWRAQTPQGFRFEAIRAAYGNAALTMADDVAVARAAGLQVQLVQGHEDNFKITHPADLDRAETVLRGRDR